MSCSFFKKYGVCPAGVSSPYNPSSPYAEITSGAGVAGTGERKSSISPAPPASEEDEAGDDRTHCTESRRRDLFVNGVPWASLAGDMSQETVREGVEDDTSVPLRLAIALGSMLLRRR